MESESSDIDSSVTSIKAINVDTVHKICSGQVVLSLAIAVKELVENSLDAGATTIDVRVKNYGMDLIEVSDNGTGVTEDNFAGLTQKYHTSKLNDYSDLMGVSSFGFRGEALSSLCALANLNITTRHTNSTYATRIEYDNKGDIVKKTPCSRQVGTTVSLTNLFSSLPVRQKDFHKNAKREFNKMVQLLYAYCLVSLGVKITCTNTTSSNSKSIVVATQASSSYQDNIACVFGSKQLQSILEVKPEYVTNIKENILKGLSMEIEKEINDAIKIEDVEINLSEESNDADNDETKKMHNNSQSISKSQGHKNIICPVNFTCFISSCAHGSGRSCTDRQYFYVNSRPCEPVKIIKLINEIYRQYNPHQYPFVFLNIDLDRSSVDVNVTPDKRKVFLTKEKIILDVIKASLIKAFQNIPSTLKVEVLNNNVPTQQNEDKEPNLSQPRIFNSFIQKFSNKSNTVNDTKEINNATDLKRKSTTMMNYISKTMKVEKDDSINCHQILDDSEDITEQQKKESDKTIEIEQNNVINETIINETHNVNDVAKDDIMYLESTDNLPNTQIRKLGDIVVESHREIKNEKQKRSPKKQEKTPKKVITDRDDLGKINKKSVTLKTSFEHVKALYDINKEQNKVDTPQRIRFRSQIDPVFNKKCEEELTKEISKNSFKHMAIVGQFNLGFIITRLDEDLFIIDQHATDEIYNFETLQKTTELTNQKLVMPQQLELTAVNEQILMDNLNIFKKNGFTFEINPEAPPTKRVKLLTLPMSKNWVFGKDDIEELLFMLRESPNEECRPSRVRAMFASRACRKSVMIGTALSKADMKTLVNHMADIDKPWNCPHGRPTIRHLVNLAMVHINDELT